MHSDLHLLENRPQNEFHSLDGTNNYLMKSRAVKSCCFDLFGFSLLDLGFGHSHGTKAYKSHVFKQKALILVIPVPVLLLIP